MDCSETSAASDLKVSRSRHLIKYMKVWEYWRSRSFLDLGPRSCTYKNSNQIFSKTTVPVWTKFLWKISDTRKSKSDAMMLVTWPSWPPRPYMVKTLQNLLLRNRRADFHETWYVALGTPANQTLFKRWPSSDLDLFNGNVKFGNRLFYGKKWKQLIFQKLLQPVTWKLVGAVI